MIDQATRDAFSQLLVIHYLRSKGARVAVCNQGTVESMFERFEPDVFFASWLSGGLTRYLKEVHRRTQIVLIDQEGGRLGEGAFKRAFQRVNDDKADLARICTRAFTWGRVQAQWLIELGLLSEDRVVVTGSPRLDPYMVPVPAPAERRYVGVTLKGDAITALPYQFMENVYWYAAADPRDWISVGYSRQAQHEDRIWHIVASTRHMLKVLIALSKQTDAPIRVRPGPWEQLAMYRFLPQRLPQVSVEPLLSQPGYIRNAFALLDESSSLGLEGLLAGVPVISIQALVPGLEAHVGGEDGALFNAPYRQAYWMPTSIEEAVDYVLKAERGELAASPNPALLAEHLRDYHGWPRERPSSFEMGDAILELMEAPAARPAPRMAAPAVDQVKAPLNPNVDRALLSGYSHVKAASSWGQRRRWLYRHVPGLALLNRARVFWRCFASRDREHLRKYHYVASLYPHRREVSATFRSLLRANSSAAAARQERSHDARAGAA